MGKENIILVGQKPDAVAIGTLLTDGIDHFKVIDRHYRDGALWFMLENISSPELELRAWFRLEDMQELAFDKKPGRQVRRFGARKGQRRWIRRR